MPRPTCMIKPKQKVRTAIFVCVYNTNAQTMENHWHASSIETADYHLCLCMRKYDAQRDTTKNKELSNFAISNKKNITLITVSNTMLMFVSNSSNTLVYQRFAV